MAGYIRAIENNSIQIKLSANLDLQTWDGWQAHGDRVNMCDKYAWQASLFILSFFICVYWLKWIFAEIAVLEQ